MSADHPPQTQAPSGREEFGSAQAPRPLLPPPTIWQSQPIESEPLEYHRLYRGTLRYDWWKPLVALVLAGVYFIVLSTVFVLVATPVLMSFDPAYLSTVVEDPNALLDTQNPVSVAFALLSIILMLPSAILALLSVGIRPTGRLWSVAARIRWKFLAWLMLAAIVGVVAMNLAGIGADLLFGAMSGGGSAGAEPAAAEGAVTDFNWTAAWVSLAIVVVLVPVQATAEEVIFRGLFMQVLGSWLKSPWFGILIPSVGFALGHIYDIWGLLQVGLMGVFAAWLTWRTGGLEAAMAIHIVNNLVAFGFMAFAVGGETAQTSDAGSAGGVIGEVVGLLVFTWLALIIFRRGGHGRTRIDWVLPRTPIPAWGAPPAAPTDSPSETRD